MITPFSVVPSRATGQATFAADAEVFWGQLPQFVTDVNQFITSLNGSWVSSSVTSVLIGTGSKSFTIGTGLGFQVGMPVRIANSSANYMTGDITSYNSSTGALVVNITAVAGSGTFASWSVYAIPSIAAQIVTGQIADDAITTPKILDLNVTNSKLAQQYINDLTTVTFDADADYLPLADASNSFNKRKALLPVSSDTNKGVVELLTVAELKTGSDATRAAPASAILGALGFSANFTSADQTITSSGLLTIAHGLGRAPTEFLGFIKNSTAEQNYSTGDIVPVPLGSTDGGGAIGCSVTADATNVYVRYGSSGGVFNVINKTTGAAANIANANWKFFVRAKA